MAHIPKKRTIAAILASGFLALQGMPEASAQMRCADRAKMVGWLEERFDETPYGIGLIGNHTVIELLVSERGTWTVLSTGVTGISCMVSAGHSWTEIPRLEGVDTSFAPL